MFSKQRNKQQQNCFTNRKKSERKKKIYCTLENREKYSRKPEGRTLWEHTVYLPLFVASFPQFQSFFLEERPQVAV